MPQQWNSAQQIHFHFFLILNFSRLYRSNKKQTNIFKDMSAFIRSKNAYQCRSHHQKRCEGKDLQALLKLFFEDYYENRLLDAEHCKKELSHYFTRVNHAFLPYLQREGRTKSLELILDQFEQNLKNVLMTENAVAYRDGIAQTDELLPSALVEVKPFFLREELQLPIEQEEGCFRLFLQAQQF